MAAESRLPRIADEPVRTHDGTLLTIRHCHSFADLDACVTLQQQTWEYEDREVLPRKGFLLARELGGQVIGAFHPSGELVAFAMSMPGFEPAQPAASAGESHPRPYLHSHMLAVRPGFRDAGLGARLKLAQREDALARGIDRMTWTFDPLAAKNAYFNLHRLGAIACRYSPDFYGVSSSRLHGGLPTDRLHAEWWMRSSRVLSRVAAILGQGPPAEEASVESAATGFETIHLPPQAATPEEARDQQSTLRALFLDAFPRHLAVTDFRRNSEGGGIYKLQSGKLQTSELQSWIEPGTTSIR
ncbi:MAG TPA: GNAT family N-acetyltransferase [Acidobacteriaceae bacterium]